MSRSCPSATVMAAAAPPVKCSSASIVLAPFAVLPKLSWKLRSSSLTVHVKMLIKSPCGWANCTWSSTEEPSPLRSTLSRVTVVVSPSCVKPSCGAPMQPLRASWTTPTKNCVPTGAHSYCASSTTFFRALRSHGSTAKFANFTRRSRTDVKPSFSRPSQRSRAPRKLARRALCSPTPRPSRSTASPRCLRALHAKKRTPREYTSSK